jgi:hypothetical protein
METDLHSFLLPLLEGENFRRDLVYPTPPQKGQGNH